MCSSPALLARARPKAQLVFPKWPGLRELGEAAVAVGQLQRGTHVTVTQGLKPLTNQSSGAQGNDMVTGMPTARRPTCPGRVNWRSSTKATLRRPCARWMHKAAHLQTKCQKLQRGTDPARCRHCDSVGSHPGGKPQGHHPHDAFAYYARDHQVRFLAAQGTSTDARFAQGIARLVRQIKAEQIKALFVENIADARLIEQIGRSQASSSGSLYSDLLRRPAVPGQPYITMMRHTTQALTNAVKGAVKGLRVAKIGKGPAR